MTVQNDSETEETHEKQSSRGEATMGLTEAVLNFTEATFGSETSSTPAVITIQPPDDDDSSTPTIALLNNPIKGAESEIDLSKLHLTLNDDSLEETATSERLKELIKDIRKDLEETTTTSGGNNTVVPIAAPLASLTSQYDFDENQILTLNESVSLISRDLLNDEIQTSIIDEFDTKFLIVKAPQQPPPTPAAIIAETTAVSVVVVNEEELISQDILEMRRQLVASSSWPRIVGGNNETARVKETGTDPMPVEVDSSCLQKEQQPDLLVSAKNKDLGRIFKLKKKKKFYFKIFLFSQNWIKLD